MSNTSSTGVPADTQVMVCPKCQGQMRTYERSGVIVDQCQECRGIFLDRGELERLVDAEGRFNTQPAQPPQPAPPQQPAQPQPGYGPPAYPSSAPAGYEASSRRGGFLGTLFGEHHDDRRYDPHYERRRGGHH